MTSKADRDPGVARGRALRRRTPRGATADWTPAAHRPDPIAVLGAQDARRAPDLVPVRHRRMAESPFAFLQGAAAIMASDLATTPTTGLHVQLCGDAHLANVGLFSSPERRLLVDFEDFDETLPGPWEWDVLRLATSFEVAGRGNGFSRIDRAGVVRACVDAYRRGMAGFADSGLLDTWFARADADEVDASLEPSPAPSAGSSAGKGRRTPLERTIERLRAGRGAMNELIERVDGHLRFADQGPRFTPLRSLHGFGDTDDLRGRLDAFHEHYLASLPEHHRHLLSQYRVVDYAHKAVGVGALGMRAFAVLLEGRGDDPLVLQVKEATSSALEAHLGPSTHATSGERVVRGQRLLQASSDIFLGWASDQGGHHYYWRQLRRSHGGVEVERFGPKALANHARLCGWSLARAHARSGDPVAIAAYMGNGSAFPEAVCTFADTYADCNQTDYEAHAAAIADGRLPTDGA